MTSSGHKDDRPHDEASFTPLTCFRWIGGDSSIVVYRWTDRGGDGNAVSTTDVTFEVVGAATPGSVKISVELDGHEEFVR